MHTTLKIMTGIVLMLALAAAALPQETESSWTGGVELDANSKYIWRSLAWSEGAVLQPNAWIGYKGLTFTVWSNFVLNADEDNGRQFNEIDYRLSYVFELGDVSITTAYNIYAYPNQDPGWSPTTHEAEVGLAYALGNFSLETNHYLDIKAYSGAYVGDVGLAYEAEAASGLTLAGAVRFAFANAKFNENYIPYGKGTLSALVLEAGLTYTFANGLYIRPHLEFNNIVDKNLRAAIEATDWVSLPKPSLFNVGVAVGFEF